ncbi:MAG: hypothetical protein C4527_00045 [Candidatus Omnitrophota bacterium]|jgi:hypothetical protein|nr:MAG: hypothetical protein C4527_00045 [Candidatus Omnitrophota bacterium]
MANKKWLWIGCGGCLSMVIVFMILLVMGGFWVKNYANRIKQNYEVLASDHRELERQYPFTAPADKTIDPQRFEKFLSVRETVNAEAQTKLDWLIQFAQTPNEKSGMTTVGLIHKFVGLPITLSEIGMTRVDALRDAAMSHKEYDHLTRVVAAELWSWRDLEDADPLKTKAVVYFKPLEDIRQFLNDAGEKNPHQEIQVGPFDLDRFLEAVESEKDEHHVNRELIRSGSDRIVAGDAIIFVDACFVQEL